MKKYLVLSVMSVLLITGCVHNNNDSTATYVEPVEVPEEEEVHVRDIRINQDELTPITSSEERRKVVELEENGSVYYLASDGKRYIFPTQEIYESWYGDYVPERSWKLEIMQEMPLGGNVTMRPGTLINTPTDFKVYLVRYGALISEVDPSILAALFGQDYMEKVVSVPNWYFTNYRYGPAIVTLDMYPVIDSGRTIDEDKGFVK